MNPSQLFLERCRTEQDRQKIDWDAAWRYCQAVHSDLYNQMKQGSGRASSAQNKPAQIAINNERAEVAINLFKDLVYQRMNLTGETYTECWNQVARERPALHNEMNTIPKKVDLSQDGQHLTPSSGPLSGNQLAALGLPMHASPEAIAIFRRASMSEITPDTACQCVVALCRHGQVEGGRSFDSVMEFLKTNLPEIWKKATQG